MLFAAARTERCPTNSLRHQVALRFIRIFSLALASIAGTMAFAAPATPPVKALLRGAGQAELRASGAELIADYGSFQLFAFRQRPQLPGNFELELRPEDDRIELNAGPIQTSLGMAQAAARGPANFSGKRLHMVQFAGPIKPEWHRGLIAAGLANHHVFAAERVFGLRRFKATEQFASVARPIAAHPMGK